MIKSVSFDGVVRFDAEGELICFCYKKDVDAGLCSCLPIYDCPEAKIEVSVISGTRPSEKVGLEVNKISKEIKDTAGKIKQGISVLENAIKKNSHFRI